MGVRTCRFCLGERFEEGSMLKSKMRLLGASALVGAGLLAVAPAEAYELRLGDVDIQVDTTVSAGASWRTADRNLGFISEGQGSDHIDNTQGFNAIVAAGSDAATGMAVCGRKNAKPAAALSATSGLNFCSYNQSFLATYGLSEVYNYDRGINGDDGRLNFDNGDLTGGTFKATADIEASWNNLRGFMRVNAFYDAVMADEGSFERTELLDAADDELVQDIKVLDMYIDADLDLFGQPLLVRAGKQVINWGESTFILGGNSAFNPIDVPAFRRPGAEVKEALIPVNALYASLSLPYELSLEAYVGEWEPFQLDAAGGPFSTSDAFVNGSAGNENKFYSGTGRYAGSNRRNCDAATFVLADGSTAAAATRAAGALENTMFGTCDEDDSVDIRNRHDVGHIEAGRKSYTHTVVSGQTNAGATMADTDFLTRGADIEGDDENYGLALRWYSEALNSTEFGIYYQKGASRIPYISGIARTPSVGISTTGIGASSTLRGAGLSGCLSAYAGSQFAHFNRIKGGANTANAFGGADYIGQDELEDVIFADPTGYGERYKDTLFDGGATQTAIVATAAAAMHSKLQTVDSDPDTDGVQSSSPGVATITAAMNGTIATALAMPDNSIAQGQNLGCIAAFANSAGGSLLPTGAVGTAYRYRGELFAEYPEVETIGASFATTVLGWGVQGEVAIRDEMPLQLDTDAIYIATIAASCAWENFANVADVYYTLQSIKTVCGQFDQKIQGYVTNEVITYDLGTTATFTRSNPVISVLGADLGILLTEFGFQVATDIEDTYQAAGGMRLASKCTTGSDLALGGVFGLDPRTVDDCRPTNESSGMVLMGQLQYNNVFGTAWGLKPTIIYRTGLDGMSPVAGGFIDGIDQTAFSLSASLQGNLTIDLGYVDYAGEELYNANLDRDTASLTVTYGF